MALANEALGAHDVSHDAVLLALDKHQMRRVLVQHGLSTLRPFRLDYQLLRERLDRGERKVRGPPSPGTGRPFPAPGVRGERGGRAA